MAFGFVTMVLAAVLLVYLWVESCLADAVVVVESKYGFAPLKRSATLVKGMRRVAFPVVAMMAILQGIIAWGFSVLSGGGRTSGRFGVAVIVQLVVCAGLSTVVALFGLGATTVLFSHCKAVNGESEKFPSDEEMKLRIYVQLPRDVGLHPSSHQDC